MRVCFLVQELGRSGGAQTIAGYARALAERDGFETELVMTDPRAPAAPADLDGIPVRAAGDAAGPYDVAIATWWATADHLWRVGAERRVAFLQSVESRFYEERHFYERFAAEEVLSLPVSYIAVASWIRELLAEVRPDAGCEVVRNGIDKSVFAPGPGPRGEGPLRVLVEGQPSMWFKGVDDAVAAVWAMGEPAELTVVAGAPEDSGDLRGARVVGGFDAAGMAALYAEHDVVVKLSRVEGLGLGPIEAAHVGIPAVVTPYTGHEEHVVHGRNGLVVGFDDQPGAVRALDLLARDRDLLRRLAGGALDSARAWPAAADSVAAFAGALEAIRQRPAPDVDPALDALSLARRRRLELTREHARQAALEEGRREIDHLSAALRDLEVLLARKDRLIADIRSERAYRAAVAVRRALLRRDG